MNRWLTTSTLTITHLASFTHGARGGKGGSYPQARRQDFSYFHFGEAHINKWRLKWPFLLIFEMFLSVFREGARPLRPSVATGLNTEYKILLRRVLEGAWPSPLESLSYTSLNKKKFDFQGSPRGFFVKRLLIDIDWGGLRQFGALVHFKGLRLQGFRASGKGLDPPFPYEGVLSFLKKDPRANPPCTPWKSRWTPEVN